MVSFTQAAFRFYEDDAAPGSNTPIAALNTNVTWTLDTAIRVRILIQETSGSVAGETPSFNLEHRIDQGSGFGAWTVIANTTTGDKPLRITPTPHHGGRETISQGIGSGTFIDGQAVDNTRNTGALATVIANGEYEAEYCVRLDTTSTGIVPASGDKVQIRVTANNTTASGPFSPIAAYTQTPEITVSGSTTLTLDKGSFTLTGRPLAILQSNADWFQEAYRFFDDDAPPATSTALALINTPITMPVDTAFQLRIRVENRGGPASFMKYRLQFRIDQGGGFDAWRVPGRHDENLQPVRLELSPHFADDAQLAQRIGSGTFVDGRAYEENRSSPTVLLNTTGANDQYELVWNLIIDSASTGVVPADTDQIEFRINIDDTGSAAFDATVTIDEVPQMTVVTQAPETGLAFPGAMGYGRFATGGRGGTVIKVTSAANSGAGTLREALLTAGPRIIIFDVNEITITSSIIVTDGDFTLAGQSAGGVQVDGDSIFIRATNFIVRGMAFRHGDEFGPYDPGGAAQDSIGTGNPFQGAHNGIFDHCVFMWAWDENVDMWRINEDITFQNCIIAQALFGSAGSRNFLIAGNPPNEIARRITICRNLICQSQDRSIRIADGAEIEYINNYVYYPGEQHRAMTVKAGVADVSIVANYYRAGAQTATTGSPNFQIEATNIYINGNIQKQANGQDVTFPDGGDSWHSSGTVVNSPTFPGSGAVPTMPADQVPAHVLANAGTIPGQNDEATQRVLDLAQNFTGTRPRDLTSVAACGDWPNLPNFVPETDTDGDGIPDSQEGTFNDLEDYLNFLIDGGGPPPSSTVLNVTPAAVAVAPQDIATRKGPIISQVLAAQVTVSPQNIATVANQNRAAVQVNAINVTPHNITTTYSPATPPVTGRVWPASLPQKPLIGTTRLTPEDPRDIFDPDSGPPLTRRDIETTGNVFSGTYLLTDAQMTTFRTFWKTTIKQGSLTFDMPHPYTNDTMTASFIEKYKLDRNHPGYNVLTVSMFLADQP